MKHYTYISLKTCNFIDDKSNRISQTHTYIYIQVYNNCTEYISEVYGSDGVSGNSMKNGIDKS